MLAEGKGLVRAMVDPAGEQSNAFFLLLSSSRRGANGEKIQKFDWPTIKDFAH